MLLLPSKMPQVQGVVRIFISLESLLRVELGRVSPLSWWITGEARGGEGVPAYPPLAIKVWLGR